VLNYVVTHVVKNYGSTGRIIAHFVGRPFSSELFIHICQTTPCHIPEAHCPNQHFYCYVDITKFKNFISHFFETQKISLLKAVLINIMIDVAIIHCIVLMIPVMHLCFISTCKKWMIHVPRK